MNTPQSTPCLCALEAEFIAGEISQAMNRAYHELSRNEPLAAAETVRAAIILHNRQGPVLNSLARQISVDLVP